jgi:hypothetical protein
MHQWMHQWMHRMGPGLTATELCRHRCLCCCRSLGGADGEADGEADGDSNDTDTNTAAMANLETSTVLYYTILYYHGRGKRGGPCRCVEDSRCLHARAHCRRLDSNRLGQ